MLYFRVRNWDSTYETAETRKLERLRWVPIPNKQDGDGYSAILDDQDGPAHFAVWTAILQLASKCCIRGLLVREMGEKRCAYDSKALARVTRMPLALVEAAIPRLCDVGWLEIVKLDDADVSPDRPGLDPAQPGLNPGRVARGREEKGMEEKGKEEREPRSLPSESNPASPGQRGASSPADKRQALLVMLTAAGCALTVKGKGILPEWFSTAKGYSLEWIQRMLDMAPVPVYPGDLRKKLREHQRAWENRSRSPPAALAVNPEAHPTPKVPA